MAGVRRFDQRRRRDVLCAGHRYVVLRADGGGLPTGSTGGGVRACARPRRVAGCRRTRGRSRFPVRAAAGRRTRVRSAGQHDLDGTGHQRDVPEIKTIGGYRQDPLKWHPNGLAIDVMIPDHQSEKGIELGNQIAGFALANAKRWACCT